MPAKDQLKDQIYHTLSYKIWKCAHEVKDKVIAAQIPSLEASIFEEFVRAQPEVMLPTIERYLTTFVNEKVAEARKRTQNYEQLTQCGVLPGELEYRLLPQEVKKRSGRESGDYVRASKAA